MNPGKEAIVVEGQILDQKCLLHKFLISHLNERYISLLNLTLIDHSKLWFFFYQPHIRCVCIFDSLKIENTYWILIISKINKPS